MKTIQTRSWLVIAGLMLVMALTRFNHFGSAFALPDASWALFFLGGLYLARLSGAGWVLAALLLEAALVDYYAIAGQGVSDWCVSNAYGFLAFAYAALWFAGRWFAPRHTLTGRNLPAVFVVAAVASVTAFVLSNASFFLFSGRYADMGALEYASRVQQYLGSYVAVTLLYVGCVIAAHMVFVLLKGKARSGSHVV
jgi:hypothetical protein